MQTNPAYIGWGTHDIDDAAVFLMQLPKDPEVYAHEFYAETVDGELRLHHRMIDTEVDEPAFTHEFEGDDGEQILTLLIDHRTYWLGFTNVEGDSMETDISMVDTEQDPGDVEPEDGVFKQQRVRDPAFEDLVVLAKLLYVEDDDDDDEADDQ